MRGVTSCGVGVLSSRGGVGRMRGLVGLVTVAGDGVLNLVDDARHDDCDEVCGEVWEKL